MDDSSRDQSKWQELRSFVAHFGLTRGQISLVLLVAVLAAIFDGIGTFLIYPILVFADKGAAGLTSSDMGALGKVFEFLRSSGVPITLPLLLGMVFVPFLGRQLVIYLRVVYVAKLTQNATRHLMADSTGRFLRADMGFMTRNNRGELYSSLLNDTRYGAGLIANTADFVTSITSGAAYCLLMFYLNTNLTFIILVSFSLLALLFRHHNKRSAEAGQRLSKSYGGVATAINEGLNGYLVVKTRNAIGTVTERVDRNARHMAEASVAYERVKAYLDNAPQPLLMAVSLGVFYTAVAILGMPLAALAAFAFASTRLVPVVSRLGSIAAAMTGAYKSCHSLLRLRDEARPEKNVVNGIRFQGLQDSIRFEDTSFRYDSSNASPVLDGISFSIQKGRTIALVGRSGAGKSTIVSMLARFYDPQAGRILVDGTEIEKYDTAAFRSRMALVPQEPVLFDDTIRNNILFGQDRPLSDEDVLHFLTKAHCADFIRTIPGGLDAPVGERGALLSGGQRQRLAMARALANQPDLLILDEPTSALDGESEAAIQSTLDELHGQLTIIVVAHRLATIRNADMIVVLEQGRVQATGTHDELVQKSTVYQSLFASQLQDDSR